ncbi:MAG: energy-coupled thiamine transporter ThiT [Oscillospiraceae bacterium]|nr:energy-coupled thiamine transporter ThiT [Oscillospiraceae bacterium]
MDESKRESKRNETLRIIVECAMLVALSCVLSIFPKFKFLPYGGSITVCSMLPVILISYRRGLKWGLLSGLVFALFQMMTGFSSAGFSAFAIAMVVLFDYLIAFTLVGLGGLFRGKLAKSSSELALGSLLALGLRYLSHVVSGYFVWGEYAEWFFSEAGEFGAGVLEGFSGNALALIYSLIYNASYMLPEMLITALVAALISKYALYNLKTEAAD